MTHTIMLVAVFLYFMLNSFLTGIYYERDADRFYDMPIIKTLWVLFLILFCSIIVAIAYIIEFSEKLWKMADRDLGIVFYFKLHRGMYNKLSMDWLQDANKAVEELRKLENPTSRKEKKIKRMDILNRLHKYNYEDHKEEFTWVEKFSEAKA